MAKHLSNPLVVGECGSAGLWPENTLAAFERAIEAGADGIELDVHLSRDGVLVVHHDEALRAAVTRGADGTWLQAPTPLIKEQTYEELQAYDVGRAHPDSAYAMRHPDQIPIDGARIPSLSSVIDLIRSKADPSFLVCVELKTGLSNLTRTADPITLADAVLDLVEAKTFSQQTILVSFDWRALAHAKRRAPHIQNAYTTAPFFWMKPDDPSAVGDKGSRVQFRQAVNRGADFFAGLDWRHQRGATFEECLLQAIASGPSDAWLGWIGDVTETTATICENLDLSVAAWLADTSGDIQRLIDLKAKTIMTTRLDIALALRSKENGL